jgi:hypothetical protein
VGKDRGSARGDERPYQTREETSDNGDLAALVKIYRGNKETPAHYSWNSNFMKKAMGLRCSLVSGLRV